MKEAFDFGRFFRLTVAICKGIESRPENGQPER
jgi:hypothetical protein